MAKTTVVFMKDDLDDGEADETLTFALEGTQYEIDLSKKNADKFRKAMEPYVGSARKTAAKNGRSSTRSRSNRSEPESAAIRAWALASGIEVNSRGRIPSSVVDQYRAAGN